MSLAQRSLTFGNQENVPKKKVGSDERKRLGVIQPSAPKQSRLLLSSNGSLRVHSPGRGKKRKNDENSVHMKPKRADGIFEDPVQPAKKQKTFASIAVQTDDSAAPVAIITPRTPVASKASSEPSAGSKTDAKPRCSTLDMLTCDTPPPEYWEGLAEKRREALEETLEENHKLHEENATLKQEVTVLKEENKLLEEMVEEAKGLAEMVQELTGQASEEDSPSDRQTEDV
ncbi:uncharacterized protein LOC122254022 [Penaeus japonicus]|uniref:uncharacterized protein LOC122254022 n=1 Tax=Penaeus japonicus TaxID=27405 RepID=UPI001C71557F|nr:uncharacterized protein LOC122254022 [Penaeus japonicus]